ncbi:FAD-dependent oxidoreductase [Bdellovibrio sp. HCB290]|uniref:FAD-dependent oxidoreductase n=1 Tax=Bdellovibrio sp. HCB290 TaxID=3394356 RepID=UPI0039B3E322
MAFVQQKNQSLWQKEYSLPDMPRLQSSLETDVCIVGAGIAGLLTAYELLQQGLKVVLVERGPLEKNETGFTTCHLSDAIDDGFAHILKIHGREKLRLFYQSHRAAIQLLEDIVKRENIDCDFQRVNGYLFLSPDKDTSYLAKEMEAALEAGAEGLKISTDFTESFFKMGPALRFENQAQMHPLKFINGLVRAILSKGGQIFEHSNAEQFHEGKETYVEMEGNHQVRCQSIVLATNGPTTTNQIYLKAAAYRTYCLALRVRRGSIPAALYWDTADSYHYMRISHSLQHPDSDILLVGGEDHRVGEGHPEKAFENLMTWARERIGFHSAELVAKWSGQIMEPVDGMAFIGRSPGRKHTYIVTGDSGHGFTHSAIASKLITGLIQGNTPELAAIYDPHRFAIKALKDYVSENSNSLQQYADWVLPHDSVETLAPDEGCIVNQGLKRIAVYRDSEGHVFKMSAVCPHLGGIVKWNTAEKTWDCPCHGSRFNKFGASLHAPATTDLKPLDRNKKHVPDKEDLHQEQQSKSD